MEIHFTRHALFRMKERLISEDEVYEIFEFPILTHERKETHIIGRTRQYRVITLVMNIKTKRLLTLWPASRSERRLYREKEGAKS